MMVMLYLFFIIYYGNIFLWIGSREVNYWLDSIDWHLWTPDNEVMHDLNQNIWNIGP